MASWRAVYRMSWFPRGEWCFSPPTSPALFNKAAWLLGSALAIEGSMWKPAKAAALWLASRAAQSYTAPTVEDARQICFKLRDEGLGTSVSFWNADGDSVE